MTTALTRKQRRILSMSLQFTRSQLTADALQSLDALRSNPPAAAVSGDLAEQASSAQLRTLSAQLVDRNSSALFAIEAALRRLERDNYGLCMDCGEPIAFQRLLIRPFARRCVDCRELLERQPASVHGSRRGA